MIVDRLDNAAQYSGLGERIALALAYLNDNDCTKLPVGKIPIQGEQVFAIVQDNTTKPRAEGLWESHRKYIDVQFVAAGIEEMGYANIQSLKVSKPWDEQTDCALYQGRGSFVTVPAGSFTIFFPEDGHIPGSAIDDQPSAVRKVVIKVAVQDLE
jgi:YhcH/YjgK/YiaL family protein